MPTVPHVTYADNYKDIEADEEGLPIAYIHPASEASIKTVLEAKEGDDDGRSEYVWLRLINGDLILGVFPRGETYMAVEEDAAFPFEDEQQIPFVNTAVKDVKIGDMLDLENDTYADTEDDNVYEMEYCRVGEIEQEDADCICLYFDNGFDPVGFPPDHIVKVVKQDEGASK